MSRLMEESPEAQEWAQLTIAEHPVAQRFRKLQRAVIWSNLKNDDGTLLIDADPYDLVKSINEEGYPLLLGHDPGKPLGIVFSSAIFTTESGEIFIAAIFGLYADTETLGFSDLVSMDEAPLPSALPALSDSTWIKVEADPREVEKEWIDQLAQDAPVRIEIRPLSLNAAESSHELIRVALPYLALVWNPFVKALATEAGKDLYPLIRKWIKSTFERMSDRKNPILEVQSHQSGCFVSFILRKSEFSIYSVAAEALSTGAVQAASLIEKMKGQGVTPLRLVYEFDKESKRWLPSFSELSDGRFITDNKLLITAENLPTGMSLGLVTNRELPAGIWDNPKLPTEG